MLHALGGQQEPRHQIGPLCRLPPPSISLPLSVHSAVVPARTNDTSRFSPNAFCTKVTVNYQDRMKMKEKSAPPDSVSILTKNIEQCRMDIHTAVHT